MLMPKVKKNFRKIMFSILLGFFIGIIMGIYGYIMNVDPILVGIFSGATTGFSIAVMLEDENLRIINMKGGKK